MKFFGFHLCIQSFSLEKDRDNGFNRRGRTDNPITTFDFGDYNDTLPEVRRRNFFTRLFNRNN